MQQMEHSASRQGSSRSPAISGKFNSLALRSVLFASCSFICFNFGASGAWAQSANANAVAVGNNLEQIVVSARKKRHEKEFVSDQTTKVLDQDQIKASSTVGGVAKALAIVPGVSSASYGSTGSSKTTISIDGIKLGWAGFSGGNPDNGSVGVSFDGVPMSNPGNGFWQTTLVPQTSLIQSMGVTYGPGEPRDRWYTNIGGGLDFTPLQPGKDFGGEIDATYGSFNTRNLSFDLQTGNVGGWETVLAGGINAADNFMKAPDGFKNGSQNFALYAKTRKTFDNGDFSLGGYAARSAAYRPLATPETPIAGVSINGYNQPGPLFSQQTTGFYTTLPGSVNNKYDTNAIKMLYGNLNINTGSNISFHNLTYMVYENRLHWTGLHDYVPGSETNMEVNQPSSFVVGDKPTMDIRLPYNNVSLGGFFQGSEYHSQEQLYSPYLSFVNSPIAVPPGLMGSSSAPNGPYNSDIFDQYDAAVFLQDTIRPISTLRITPGIRVIDYMTYFHHNESSQFPLATIYNPGGLLSQYGSAHTAFVRAEPSVGANWQVLEPVALYASWGQAYRQPENGGGTGPYVALPASAVALEKGNQYQAGVKLRWPHLGFAQDISVDASYYHLDYTNETIPTALASGGHLLAYGSSVYDGVNVFADGSPFQNFYVFANVGIVNANFLNYTNANGTFHNVPVPNTPDSNFNFGLYYQWMLHDVLVQPRLSYQYTGSQHIYDNSQNITSNQKLPSFGVVNFSTEVDVPLTNVSSRIKTLNITLEVDNVMDTRYNSFAYVSAGGLYGSGGYTNPTTVGAGSLLALPGAPRAVYVTAAIKF